MMLFSELNKNLQRNKCIIPYAVFSTQNPDDETPEQIINRQEKFLKLPEHIKDKLISPYTSEKIQEIEKKYNLQLLQLADIARAIRSYYFGEVKLEDFPAILSREMEIDINTATEISQNVIAKIINDDSQEKAYQNSLEKINLQDALKKYPEISDQLVTSSPISIKTFPQPVHPTIKNWLSDYTFNLGYEMHSSMARGNYMFQNENTKNLNAGDREKLSYILKAFDEKTPITINTNTKQVVFPAIAPASAPASRPEVKPRMDNLSGPEIKKETIAKIAPTQRMNFQSSPTPTQNYNYQPTPAPTPIQKPAIETSPKPISVPTPAQDTNLKFTSTQKMPFEYEREKIQESEPIRPKAPVQPQPLNHSQFQPMTKPQPQFQSSPPAPQPQEPAFQSEPPTPPQPAKPQPPTHPIRISSHQRQEPDRMQPLPRNVVNLKE